MNEDILKNYKSVVATTSISTKTKKEEQLK